MKTYFYSAVIKDREKELLSCGTVSTDGDIDFIKVLDYLAQQLNTLENQKVLGYEITSNKVHLVAFNRID